jgi:hypothetical protein
MINQSEFELGYCRPSLKSSSTYYNYLIRLVQSNRDSVSFGRVSATSSQFSIDADIRSRDRSSAESVGPSSSAIPYQPDALFPIVGLRKGQKRLSSGDKAPDIQSSFLGPPTDPAAHEKHASALYQ